jgi:hypothetical protein
VSIVFPRVLLTASPTMSDAEALQAVDNTEEALDHEEVFDDDEAEENDDGAYTLSHVATCLSCVFMRASAVGALQPVLLP